MDIRFGNNGYSNERQILFPKGFLDWMKGNAEIWEEFERRALELAQFKKYYGARTIIESMRFDTDVQSKKENSQYKINNNYIPGIARLWMQMHGHKYPNFFHLKNV